MSKYSWRGTFQDYLIRQRHLLQEKGNSSVYLVHLKPLKLKCASFASLTTPNEMSISNRFTELAASVRHWSDKQIAPPQTHGIGWAKVRPIQTECLKQQRSTNKWLSVNIVQAGESILAFIVFLHTSLLIPISRSLQNINQVNICLSVKNIAHTTVPKSGVSMFSSRQKLIIIF